MSQTVINIKRSGNILEIDPGRVDVLGPVLTYSHNSMANMFNPMSRDNKVSVQERELFRIQDGKLYTLQGAYTRVVNALTRAGCQCMYTDMREKKTLEPDYEWFAKCMPDLEFRFKQEDILATLIGVDSGVIIAPTAYGKTFIMLALAALYPKANIIMASPSTALLRSTYKRMLKITGHVGRVGGGYNQPEQVTLCTFGSIMGAPVNKCDILVIDECVAGDSIITTELGDVQLDAAEKLGCKYVLTRCGPHDTFKRIVKYYEQGTRATVNVITDRGILRCTPDHKLMTDKGWEFAKDLLPSSKIRINGSSAITIWLRQRLYASAAVAKEFVASGVTRLNNYVETVLRYLHTGSIALIIGVDTPTGQLNLKRLCSVNSWEHCWATAVWPYPTRSLSHQDLHGITDLSSVSGSNTKYRSWIPVYTSRTRKNLTVDGVKLLVEPIRLVILSLYGCINFCIQTVRRLLAQKRFSYLQPKASRGGSAMMAQAIRRVACCLHMGLVNVSNYLSELGSRPSTTLRSDFSAIKYTACGYYAAGVWTGCGLKQLLRRMFQRTCDTNYATVLDVIGQSPVKVYDIEVEDTHCFYANGLLVHNCHASAAPQISSKLAQIRSPVKIFGMTATLKGRSDNAELPIEVMIGPVITEVNYDEAADAGVVSPIKVGFIEMPEHCTRVQAYNYSTKVAKKRNCYWRNAVRNEAFANAVRTFPAKLGMRADPQVLVLTETIEHAFRMAQLLPGYDVVYANMAKDRLTKLADLGLLPDGYKPLSSRQRDEMLSQFEAGNLRKVIATGCWGTGVDFVYLDVIVNVSGSPSPISTIQWAGRNSRMYEGKTFGLLIDSLDTWDAWANGRAKLRVREYKKKKWEMLAGLEHQAQPELGLI